MKHRSIHAVVVLIGLPFLLETTSAAAEGLPWVVDLEAAAGTNSNIGQAEKDRDIIDDRFLSVDLGATYTQQLNASQAISVRGFLETEHLQEVSGLSRITAGAQFIGNWQPSAGPTAPAYQFNVSLQADEYDYEQRDSTVVTSQLVASKPFTDRISAATGVEYKGRDSAGTVFDLEQWRWFLDGSYAFPPGWTVYGTYSFIYGDVWSTAQTEFCNGATATDIYPLIVASDAIEPDAAFNDAFCGNWLAYRLTAHANTLKIGVSKDIGRDLLVDFSVIAVQVDAKGGNEYDTEVFRLSLAKRF